MKEKDYSVEELRILLDNLSGMYDVVRIVDPDECRVLKLFEDGRISPGDSCYGIWNADRKCLNCSSALAGRTGCHQEKSEHFKDHIYNIQSNPIKIKLSDGGIYSAVLEMVSVRSEQDSLVEAPLNDREYENTVSKTIEYREMHDSLTGTLKLEPFYEKAREMLSEKPDEQWTMVTGDIMEFRIFNSLFGSEKGNEALMVIADQLEKIAFENKGLCCRLYRDKFALLIPGSNYREKDFTDAVSVIRETLSNGIYKLCFHFGVYECDNADVPVSVMIDRANMALRSIHKDFRSSIAYFDGDIMQKSLLEQEIISSFDNAVKTGAFQMYLQPLTREDGVPFGAEALVRWIRPDGSFISPAVFIETLERAGLIHELDKIVWEQAVRRLGEWKRAGKTGMTISVNMSPKDFYSMDIYSVLTELTEKYGVDSSRLRLEITESALMEEPERSYPVIEKLQKAGFLFEIDDFGKGYSSLNLLKDINADILKIDMGFLRETENIKRTRIILKAVIAMATELGMQVITEGVETEKQLKLLVSMGCTRFQGYYFSRPVPVHVFEKKYMSAV